MKLSIYPILMLLLLGLACDLEEEDPDPIVISQEQLFIEEVTRNSVIYEDYTYNDKDQLISKRTYLENGELGYTYSFEYLEDKTISTRKREETGDLLIYEYSEVDALTARRDRINEDGTLSYYHLFTYASDDACYYNKKSRFTADDVFDGEGTYAFSDDNCSYILTQKDVDGEILYRSTLVKDGKNRYDNAAKIPQLPIRFGNSESSDFEAVNISAEAITFTANFEYNIFDYPAKQTRFLSNGEIEELVFNYR